MRRAIVSYSNDLFAGVGLLQTCSVSFSDLPFGSQLRAKYPFVFAQGRILVVASLKTRLFIASLARGERLWCDDAIGW